MDREKCKQKRDFHFNWDLRFTFSQLSQSRWVVDAQKSRWKDRERAGETIARLKVARDLVFSVKMRSGRLIDSLQRAASREIKSFVQAFVPSDTCRIDHDLVV